MDTHSAETLAPFDTRACIHCGMCLQACPTYVETGNEAHSPRGRIYSLRAVAEGRLSWAEVQEQMDACLGCLACETACPSPVPYEKILMTARSEIDRRRPPWHWFARHMLVSIAQSPKRFAQTAPLAAHPLSGRILGLALGGGTRLPLIPIADEEASLPEMLPAVGEQRGTVALLVGCVQRVTLPATTRAAARCLSANGYEVLTISHPECCGALAAHYGDPAVAQRLADDLASACPAHTPLIVTAAGCGAFLKQALRDRDMEVFDFSEFLWSSGWTAPLDSVPRLRVALHDPCHLEHGQGIKAQPRELLSLIPGIEPLELDESYCCGSAGLYNVYQPVMARKLLERKLDAIIRTGADIVLSSNPGCTLWLHQGIEERGLRLQVLHIAEVMASALTDAT
ncbi:MAG: (Fe-S)-binding protein [Fimbriimonadia bacterium]